MSDIERREDEWLARELGRLAGFGRGWLTRRAAARLPTERTEVFLITSLSPADMLAAAAQCLSAHGRLTGEFADPAHPDRVSAIVGSGHLDLNPTIVHVEVTPVGECSSSAAISGAAKEGIVKQRSVAKALERVQPCMVAIVEKTLPSQLTPTESLRNEERHVRPAEHDERVP